MHLSEISIIAKHLDTNTRGAIISNIYRSNGGTLLKLFGSEIKGIYFNTKEKVIFPVSNISLFEREPLSRVEEGLRANLTGRILQICLLEEYGKVIAVKTFSNVLFVPLFGGRGIFIHDNSDKVVWSENKHQPLLKLETPLKHIPPDIENPELYETVFLKSIEEKEKKQLDDYIENKLKSLLKLKYNLETQLEECNIKSSEFFDKAQILKANLYQLDGNSRKSSVEVYDNSLKIIEIDLKPDITIIENLNLFYKKAGKFKKGISHTSSRLESTILEIEEINAGTYCQNIPKGQISANKSNKKETHNPAHQYKSASGRVFFVGKGSKDNDVLTFKIASPHDLWFHAKDQSGSHVIMKIDKNEKPSKDDIFNGSVLALYYSKLKKSLSGEVWVTRRKNIQKKKGMPPGKVLIKKGEVINVSAEKLPEKLIKTEQTA